VVHAFIQMKPHPRQSADSDMHKVLLCMYVSMCVWKSDLRGSADGDLHEVLDSSLIVNGQFVELLVHVHAHQGLPGLCDRDNRGALGDDLVVRVDLRQADGRGMCACRQAHVEFNGV
jgi:hypothetical protein